MLKTITHNQLCQEYFRKLLDGSKLSLQVLCTNSVCDFENNKDLSIFKLIKLKLCSIKKPLSTTKTSMSETINI